MKPSSVKKWTISVDTKSEYLNVLCYWDKDGNELDVEPHEVAAYFQRVINAHATLFAKQAKKEAQ